MKRRFYLLGAALLVLVLYIGMVLLFGTLQDWRPQGTQSLTPLAQGPEGPIADSTLSFVTYNIGYAGLGAESDFFYEQGGFFLALGKRVRPKAKTVDAYLGGSRQIIAQTKADFFLLQEVDSASKRSYYTAQLDTFRTAKPDYSAYYAPNYRVNRVPIPILEPWRAYGQTESGLLSLSRFTATAAERIQLPGEYAWPTRIFQLDRCALLQRFPTSWGKELVVVHLHLSAYDQGGVLKQQQMDFLRALVLQEYQAGNYVVVGGDWNQAPPFFKYNTFAPDQENPSVDGINIPEGYLPADWQWVYDPTQPTNRSVAAPYNPETTFRGLIDFYLLSPNVQAKLVKTLNQDFRYSDHQPVYLEVLLK